MARTESRPLVVHEWIEKLGGSEKVVAQVRLALGDTDVEALWADHPEAVGARPGPVRESVLARTPLRRSKALALPLMPFVWRLGARRRDRSCVVVSSHLFAHHARVPAGVPKLVYVHTPARYIWNPDLDPRGASLAARAAARLLKPLDRARAREATSVVANSAFVAQRIRDAWRLEPSVIHPPVAVERIQAVADWSERLDAHEREILDSLPGGFVLGASRFIAYKRLERVIDVAVAAGLPVVLAGAGPLRAELERHGAAVAARLHVVESPSDALLYAIYQRASVLVFPAIEDFGMVPVEAMAAGLPVIAHHVGGACESVEHGVSGFLVDIEDDAAVTDAVTAAGALDARKVAASARRFGEERFRDEVRAWVAKAALVGDFAERF